MPLYNRAIRLEEEKFNEHSRLQKGDVCYYFGEYTSGQGFKYSETNQLIANFKKSPSLRMKSEWKYKEDAIKKVANLIKYSLKKDLPITFVPIPSSKTKSHEDYDDRLSRTLDIAFSDWTNTDIRELIIQKEDIEPFHSRTSGRNIEELLNVWELNQELIDPKPDNILLFDDILTTGCHFKAAQYILQEQFPNTPICGLFIARRDTISYITETYD